MREPPSERHGTLNAKRFCELLQTLAFRTVTDYGEVRCTRAQKLRCTPQRDIASLKRYEAAHKNQLELPTTRGAGSRWFLQEGRVNANLSRNEKKPFPILSEFCIRMRGTGDDGSRVRVSGLGKRQV